MAAFTVLFFAVVLTQSSPFGGKGVGVRSAAAKCAEDQECYPSITMTDMDGKQWRPEDLLGKVVLINYWATWCRPCIEEIPLLAEVADKRGEDGVVVIGIVTDSPSAEKLARFRQTTGLNFPVVRSTEEITRSFGRPSGLPTTLIYGRDGHLDKRQLGPITPRHVEHWIDPLVHP